MPQHWPRLQSRPCLWRSRIHYSHPTTVTHTRMDNRQLTRLPHTSGMELVRHRWRTTKIHRKSSSSTTGGRRRIPVCTRQACRTPTCAAFRRTGFDSFIHSAGACMYYVFLLSARGPPLGVVTQERRDVTLSRCRKSVNRGRGGRGGGSRRDIPVSDLVQGRPPRGSSLDPS